MGSALRHIALVPSPICGGTASPRSHPREHTRGWLWLKVPELAALHGEISPAALLKTCLSVLLEGWLCLPRRFSVETPALTRAGGSDRCCVEGTPPAGTPVWPLHPPQIFQPLFPHWHPLPGGCHLHRSPLHPSLLGAVPPFVKADFEVQSWSQYVPCCAILPVD